MMKDPVAYEQQSFIYQMVIYGIGFLLFIEWLRPLESITNTEDVSVFLIYAAFCFFISFLRVHGALSIPLKLLGLAFIIDGLYMAETIFSRDWFTVIYEQVAFNVQVIQEQEWWKMTPVFRSLLFLVLLWLMSYLLYYWFVIAKRMFVFVVLTFIYVTVLDTFTVYDGQWAIIRTFIFAMVALGLSNFSREMDHEAISFKGFKKAHLWALPLLAVVLFSTVAAYASPKLSPQWADPVPYLKSASEGAGAGPGGVVQKVGYGENDRRLGGSFIQDNTPVFRVVADQKRYWRIESKDMYTGKGWKDTLAEPMRMVPKDQISYQTFSDQVEVDKQTAFLNFTSDAEFYKLVYPYGVNSITNTPEEFELRLHENTGEIDTLVNNDLEQLRRYELTYRAPSFEYGQLREASTNDPAEVKERYLQLPEGLPDRVRHLAGQIVEDEDNRYDRVKAVESYFSLNGFEYSTKNVPVPGEHQDYVDQFLFETQVGYCDNFSTSMVVLLRSQGIPARWVKGFTGGRQIDVTDDVTGEVMGVYEVTSANAHSWVEVYFPDVGWVPFEPTKGFSNNADFHTEIDSSGNEGATGSGSDTQTPEEVQGNPQQVQDQPERSGASQSNGSEQLPAWIWLASGALGGIGVVLYLTRYRWMTAYYVRRYRKEEDGETYEKAYQYLLKVLDHRGYKRSPEQTLRDYAVYIDAQFQSDEMRRLTNNYERILYRNEDDSEQWRKVTELWENLIKKALS